MTSFRIIFDLIDDQEVWENRTSLRIYRELYRLPHIYHIPQPVKTWLLAERLKTNRGRIKRGLDLLVRKGYATDCGKDEHGVRQIMLVIEKQPPKERAA